MNSPEKELQILENIHTNGSHIRQRDLAEIAGLSLGMTNAILKRLVHKGWLTIKKVNNRNIRYVVSSKGIEAITRRSYRYFKRTIKNVVYYKEAIDDIVREIQAKGYEGLVLVGKSDVDFIVEHCCHKWELPLVRNVDGFKGRLFHLYSESYIPDTETLERNVGSAFLQSVFINS